MKTRADASFRVIYSFFCLSVSPTFISNQSISLLVICECAIIFFFRIKVRFAFVFRSHVFFLLLSPSPMID